MKFVNYNGKRMSISELSRFTGCSYQKLRRRLEQGIPVEKAVDIKNRKPGKKPTYMTEYKGKPISIHELSLKTGKHYNLLRYRIEVMGMTAEEAVDRPSTRGSGIGVRKNDNGCHYHDNCLTCPFSDCIA